jgi:hypothetical protein
VCPERPISIPPVMLKAPVAGRLAIDREQDVTGVEAQFLSRRTYDLKRGASRGGHDKWHIYIFCAPDVLSVANLKQHRPGKKNCETHVLDCGRRRISSAEFGGHASAGLIVRRIAPRPWTPKSCTGVRRQPNTSSRSGGSIWATAFSYHLFSSSFSGRILLSFLGYPTSEA